MPPDKVAQSKCDFSLFTGDWFEDLCVLEGLMDEVKFYAGTERKTMMKKGGLKMVKDSGSMLYGLTWRGYLSPTKNRTKDDETGLYRTKIMDLHPELSNIFKEFANIYFPDFNYSQVQMNKNFLCPPHRDSKNIGESVLVAFGDYTGGLTGVDINSKVEKLDPRLEPVRFDGSKNLHWVEPYEGKRYSLVFFNNNKIK